MADELTDEEIERKFTAMGHSVTEINEIITEEQPTEYIRGRPELVYWGYVIVNEKPTYDPAQSAHFQLHASEQPDIVIKVLELAGISIEDPQLTGIASQEEQQNTADERI